MFVLVNFCANIFALFRIGISQSGFECMSLGDVIECPACAEQLLLQGVMLHIRVNINDHGSYHGTGGQGNFQGYLRTFR